MTMLSLSQSDAIYFNINRRHVACSTLPDNSEVISYTNVGQFSLICITNMANAVHRDYSWGLEFSSIAILFIITIEGSIYTNFTYQSSCLSVETRRWNPVVLAMRSRVSFCSLEYLLHWSIPTKYSLMEMMLPSGQVEGLRGPEWWWSRLDEFLKIATTNCLPTWVLADRIGWKKRDASVAQGSGKFLL